MGTPDPEAVMAPGRPATLVCVVEDDESVRESLRDLLSAFGYEVRAFSSAEAFLGSGRLHDVGCLITDLQMPPGMSGLELQARLSHENPDIAVIFITAHGEPRLRAQAMDAGAAAFLVKPFDNDVLLATVLSIIKPVQ